MRTGSEAGADRYERLLEATLMGQDRDALFDAAVVRVGALVLLPARAHVGYHRLAQAARVAIGRDWV